MKKLNLLVIALFLTIFMACQKDKAAVIETHSTNEADTLIIKMNETIFYGDFSIKLDSVVMDYRCPINACCITQGTAIAKLIVQKSGHSDVIRLATVPKINSIALFDNVTVFNHHIRLVDVSPYPNWNKIAQNDYVIKLLVK